MVLEYLQNNITVKIYQMWRNMVGTELRPYLKPNMLANICRDIERKNKKKTLKCRISSDKTKY